MVRGAVLAVAALTVLSFAGPFSATLDLLSHWRVQILALAIAVCIATAFRGTRRTSIGALAVLLLNAWPIAQHSENAAPRLPAGELDTKGLALLGANLGAGDNDPEALARLLNETEPDIAVFTEVSEDDLVRIRSMLPDWLFQQSGKPDSLGSVLIASRHPVRSLHTEYPTTENRYIVTIAEICPDSCVRLAALHAAHPEGLLGRPVQAMQFEAIANWVSANGPIDFLVGDLNTTPWAPAFHLLSGQGAGFRDAAPWHALNGTWPAAFQGAGLRLDHILVSADWGVRSYSIEPSIGSDHLPVAATVAQAAEP